MKRVNFKSPSFVSRLSMFLLGTVVMLSLMLSSCKKDDIISPAANNDSYENTLSSSPSRLKATTITNGVMMQGFYWDVPTTTPAGDWWQNLGSKAVELSQAGITAMWLPPAYKGNGGLDVGYGVYDRYDLGEFNQKGTVATRYGTLAHLTSAINSLHAQNIQVYEDIVMNHLMGADYTENVNGNSVWTGFSYSGRNNTYSSYKFNRNAMNGWQGGGGTWYQWNAWDFSPYNNNDAYDNLMGCEIRYNGGTAGAETINWGKWITTKMNLDGYRCDATKHVYTPFLNSWFDNVKGTKFAVSEAWFNSVQQLNDYAAATGGRTSLFDVPLHYTFQAMSSGNGSWDMRGLQFAGFTEANGALSVSFVDNHDTDTPGALYSPVINLKMLAYAYILTREKGYPCVFYRDYYEYGLGNQIKTLLSIRKNYAYGSGYEYTSNNDGDLYVYSRSGDATHAGLLLLLNDGGATRTVGVTTPFKNATLTDKTGNVAGSITTNASGYAVFSVKARSYAVWVPGTTPVNQAPVVTVNPAGPYTSSAAFNVTITGTDDSGVAPTLYYTTNGTTPTTASASAVGTKTITISASCTLKVMAKDNLGLTSTVASHAYTISASTTTAVSFNVSYSGTTTGQDVYIVGSTAQLGSWNTANAIKLSGATYPVWKVTLNLTTGTYVEYKYFRRTGTDASTIVWETTAANKTYTPTGATATRNDTW